MGNFLSFILENFIATAAMIGGFIASIIAIVNVVKKPQLKKRYLYMVITISVFMIAFLYLVFQYFALRINTATADNEEIETTYIEETTEFIDSEGTSEIDKESEELITQSPEHEIDVGDITGGNTIISGTGNTIIDSGSTTIIVEPPTISVTVTSVTLSESSLEMKVGDAVDLSAVVLYSDNTKDDLVTWISSNKSIVSVDEKGHIVAHAAGSVEIIVQATKNNSTKEARCKIDVNSAPSGYSISLSTSKTMINNAFDIYIEPYDEVTQIKVHAKAPSGQIFTKIYNEKGYVIYTEIGTWVIYATLENSAGVYEATKEEDFVTIEVERFKLDSLFPNLSF